MTTNFYTDQLQLITNEIALSEKKFIEYLQEFYHKVSVPFTNAQCIKTLSAKWSQFGEKKITQWYASTFKSHGDLLISMANCDMSNNDLLIKY